MVFWLLPALIGAGLSGGLSYASNRDPKQALLSALLGGLTGGVGSALSGGAAAAGAANASAQGAKAALQHQLVNQVGQASAKQAAATALTQQIAGQSAKQALQGAATQAIANGGRQAGLNSLGLGGVGKFVMQHPGLTAGGGLALMSLLSPTQAGFQGPDRVDIPTQYPAHPGPRNGFSRNEAPIADYLTYGQPDAPNEDEAQFFYRKGGLIRGPGTGTSDSIPALGPKKTPLRLSNGEYVMTKRAVSGAGGPKAMRRLQKALEARA